MERTVRTLRRSSSNSSGNSSSWQRFVSLLAVALTAAGSLWVMLAEPATSAAARTWYVATDGDDNGTGYADDPLATIDKAVRRASSGDTVRIAAGRYHESVQIYGESLRIVGAGVGETVLDGARPVSGFTRDADGRHSAPWSTSFQRAVPPHVFPDRPEAGWPEQFFLDGVVLAEVPSRDDVGPGTFYHDLSAGRVVLGDDPTGRLVEGSDLSWGIYFNHADGSSLERLSVNRYATEERHMAAVRAYADDLLVKDVEVRDNARIGLSMIGERIEARRVDAIDNGYMGLHAHFAADIGVFDSEIRGNNREVFDAWHASAGMKITESHGIVFSDNVVTDNHGPGFWTDLSVYDTVVKNNYFRDNYRSGVEIELSTDVIVVDNVMTGNGEQGVWVLESSRVDVWHNYLAGNERGVWVLDGPRSDVNHVRIGNNVLADPSSAGMLLSVDDWTEDRNATEMQVSIDGNRYYAANHTTGLVRWANWPASLTIAGSLDEVQNDIGQEQHGVAVRGGGNPFSSAQVALVPVPDHVQAVRNAGSDSSTPPPPPTTAPPTTTTPSTTAPPTTTTPSTTAPPTTTTPSTTAPPSTTTPSTTTPSSTTEPPTTEPPASTTTTPTSTTTSPSTTSTTTSPNTTTSTPASTSTGPTTHPSTSGPGTTTTTRGDGVWTSPAVVRNDSRPVRVGGSRNVASSQPVNATTTTVAVDTASAPLAGDDVASGVIEVAESSDVDGWRTFAEELDRLLRAAD